MAGKCLYCYQEFNGTPGIRNEFHPKCSKNIFGDITPNAIPYSLAEISKLAGKIVQRSVTIPGVQPKLSLEFKKPSRNGKKKRFTLVALWGSYILKPPTDLYPQLPEIEDLTMRLAQLLKITTVEHSLVRMKSGELAYLTKRIDRLKNSQKLHMEDMCQLTERLTDDKYNGSMEQIGKVILKHTSNPGLEAIRYFEISLFSFITGNSDMHLKNFSLITSSTGLIELTPAYDLVATKLLIPKDKEEMALTINGEKSNLRIKDFGVLAERLNINDRAKENIYKRFKSTLPSMIEFIDMSFLNTEFKEEFKTLISLRAKRMGLLS